MASDNGSPTKKRFISESGNESVHKYQLREVSKPPTRYKDYFNSTYASEYSDSIEKSRKRHKSLNTKVGEIEQKNNESIKTSLTNIDSTYSRQSRKMLRPSKIDMNELRRKNSRCAIFCTKLKKTRQWMQYEFFYSALDYQLYLGDNDFNTCLKTDFPNLKTRILTMPEWRIVKKLIGKPRRFSQSYLVEEMQAIEMKRNKLRMIYNGNISILQPDWSVNLPLKIPRPLVVGQNVFVRLTKPTIGVFYGKIDAVYENSFKIIFEDDTNLPSVVVDDVNVMPEILPGLVSVQYFIDQFRNNSCKDLSKNDMYDDNSSGKIINFKDDIDDECTVKHPPPRHMSTVSVAKDDKVGNFPVRMLVLLVKLHKLVNMKKEIITHLDLLNSEAEKCHLVSGEYPFELQQSYGKSVIQLEKINETTKSYIKMVNEYIGNLQPTNYCKTDRIIKININCEKTKTLIKNLTKLLLMFRTFGCEKKEVNLYNFYATITDNISEMKDKIKKENKRIFESEIEVNFKELVKIFEDDGKND
uniref:DIRP domain-containing protein n=1 Tax=Strongyloides stercoralis TaxID=6248 RepID=A0A0K0EDB6_STRER